MEIGGEQRGSNMVSKYQREARATSTLGGSTGQRKKEGHLFRNLL
jgi:hypothetical protein